MHFILSFLHMHAIWPFLQRIALRNSSACSSSLLIVAWSLTTTGLGLSSSSSSLKLIKCSCQMTTLSVNCKQTHSLYLRLTVISPQVHLKQWITEIRVGGGVTFTLSLLKQQNIQFSSNDQSDTVVGSRSIKIKHTFYHQNIQNVHYSFIEYG